MLSPISALRKSALNANGVKRKASSATKGQFLELVRRGNMLRSMVGGVLLVFAILALVSGSATAGQKGDKGDKGDKGSKVVAKWDWTVTNENDKFVEKGTWIVKGYEIFNGRNQRVGKYIDDDKTHVNV